MGKRIAQTLYQRGYKFSNRHKKRCSSWANGEMQDEVTVRHHCTPTSRSGEQDGGFLRSQPTASLKPSRHTSGRTPYRNGNSCPHKSCTQMFRVAVLTMTLRLGTTQMCFPKWVDNWPVRGECLPTESSELWMRDTTCMCLTGIVLSGESRP